MLNDVSHRFVHDSVGYLRDTYLPRLRRVLVALPNHDLWWRPHDQSLSVGVILRHLEGNVRQWILSGLAGTPDHRQRSAEFADTQGTTGEELLQKLNATVLEAAEFVESMVEPQLIKEYTIQGSRHTGLSAVYHVVEHFSWHTGQAVWIAKARGGVDHGIAFHDDAALDDMRNPTSPGP